jgi:hypothetical protein
MLQVSMSQSFFQRTMVNYTICNIYCRAIAMDSSGPHFIKLAETIEKWGRAMTVERFFLRCRGTAALEAWIL